MPDIGIEYDNKRINGFTYSVVFPKTEGPS